MEHLAVRTVGLLTGDGTRIAVWQIGTLWRAADGLPAHQIPLASFETIFAEQTGYWWYGTIPSLGEVADRAQRIVQADLEYPILLAEDGSLLDGRHRLAKAWMLRAERIAVVQFAHNPPPDYWLDVQDLPVSEGHVNAYIPDERLRLQRTASE